jgi:hypothetical protein
MAAQITIDQPSGAGSGTPGESRTDIWLSQQVNLTSSGTGSSYLWELLDQPPGSAAVINNPTLVTADITPDVVGTYRFRLTVDGGGSGNVTIRIMRVRYTSTGVLTKRGWALPAVEENDDENNESGNTRGWAPGWESIVSDINAALTTLVYHPGGGVDSGHVFETWEILMETFSGIAGPVVIEVDDSVSSPATIPAGTWSLDQRVTFVGRGVNPQVSLRLGNGAYLENPSGFQRLDVDVNGTDVGSVTLGAGKSCVIEDCNFQNGSSAGPLLTVDQAVILARGATTISTLTAQPAVLCGTTIDVTFVLEDAVSIGIDALAGSPTSVTVNLIGVSSSCSSTQTGLAGTFTINSPTIPEPYTFVYRPGYAGSPKPNVYTSWSTLMTELALVEGPKIVQFDDTDGAVTIPSGTWDFGYTTTLRGLDEDFSTGLVTVTVQNGGVLKDVYAIHGIKIVSTSSSAIFSWKYDGMTQPLVLHMDYEGTIDSTGASAAPFSMGNGDRLIISMRGYSLLKAPSGGSPPVFDLTHANADMTVLMYETSRIENDVIETNATGAATVFLMSNTAQYSQGAKTGLTVSRVASRRRIYTLSKTNITEATGTPVVTGAVYVDPEEIPNFSFWSQFNPTAKFRVIMETTSASQAAVMDLFDTNGVFNAGTPAVVSGSQQDTATGTSPPRPGGGTPLTPNPIVASAYEVDVSTAFFGSSWTDPGVFEARLWVSAAGGGNVATCKSAELIIEW